MSNPAWLEQAEELRASGLNMTTISKRLEIPYTQLRYWLVARRREGRADLRLRDHTPLRRSCRHCGEEFEVPKWYGGLDNRGLYCSRDCLNAWQQRQRKSRKCPICDATYPTVGASARRARTCGNAACVSEAKSRAKRGRRNPNFRNGSRAERQSWRASIEEVCVVCGAGSILHLHHVVYEQKVRLEGGPIFDARNSLTLCRECHLGHHHSGKKLGIGRLRDVNFAFAAQLLGPAAAHSYLSRRYAGDDERLDALLNDDYDCAHLMEQRACFA